MTSLLAAALLFGLSVPARAGIGEPPDSYVYRAFIDTDSNSATGCDVSAHDDNFAGPVPGIEYVVTAYVARFPTMAGVDAVRVEKCVGGSLAPPIVVDSLGWNVGLENGINGADVVEFRVPRAAIGNPSEVTLAFHATRFAIANDVLLTTNGQNGGDPIVFPLPPSQDAPALSAGMLIIAALLLAGVAWWSVRHRRRAGLALACLAVVASLSATAWAATILLDGAVTDWDQILPIAEDVLDDSTADDPAEDIVAAFAIADASNIYFRMDLVNIAPTECGNGVVETGEQCETDGGCDIDCSCLSCVCVC